MPRRAQLLAIASSMALLAAAAPSPEAASSTASMTDSSMSDSTASSTSSSTSPEVTQILLPFADDQTLVASVIGTTASDAVCTLAIQCATPDDVNCGFPEPLTVTAGPSTFHFQPPTTGIYSLLGEIDCKISGTSEANCMGTMGVYNTESLDAYYSTATDTGYDSNVFMATATTTTSIVLTGTDLVFCDVTLTAAAVATDSGSASATATGTEAGASATSAAASSSASGASAAASASASRSGSTASGSGTTSATRSGIAMATGAASRVQGMMWPVGAGLLALPMFLL